MRIILALLLLNALPGLPPRPADAPGGAAFARSIAELPLRDREAKIQAQVLAGNVPDSWRAFVPVTIERDGHSLTYKVSPDYLSIGSDQDAFRTPLTPFTAQKIADALDCVLPTPRMVDDIYLHAPVKLKPSPIPPSPRMTTIPVFLDHDAAVDHQREGKPAGALTAGHKKDVVLTNKLLDRPNSVAIYGWHQPGGKPIQPVYAGHAASWVDYSHGIRLVQKAMILDGRPATFETIVSDPKSLALLSNEGVLRKTRYDFSVLTAVKYAPKPIIAGPGESVENLTFEPGVRVVINRPDPFPADRPVLLVLYALPNGNTTEWTIGKALKPGDDWHYDIQHIGAQVRFLREAIRDRTVVVAYLENDLKAWPAWRRTHGNDRIPALFDRIKAKFPDPRTRLVLTGHSGGGSLTFGYLQCVETIPHDIERIAFLDSNYAYESERHSDKLTGWLRSTPESRLVVIAYNDAVALLNGKPFVSEKGGTWGRSRAMLDDLRPMFDMTETRAGDLRTLSTEGGMIRFLLLENPGRKIFHTVQVEKIGLIEAVLSGTPNQGRNYRYLGDRAYAHLIRD